MSTEMSGANALPKGYEPQQVEGRIYDYWLRAGVFNAEVDHGKLPFCIVIPPPNVTGILHMGHALDNAIQDLLTRWKHNSKASHPWTRKSANNWSGSTASAKPSRNLEA